MRSHKYDFDTVVVGHSLPAVLYAYLNGLPILLNAKDKPFRFEETIEDVKEHLGMPTINAEAAWSHMLLKHAIDGMVPFGTAIENIRFEGDEMSISLGASFGLKARFTKCIVFEDDNLTLENGVVDKGDEVLKVLDWFDVRSGMKHEVDSIDDSDEFVKKVHFYVSERIDGNKTKKDCVAESYMTIDKFKDFDYSATMARFKTEKLMKEFGILGAKRGFTPSGKQIRIPIKLETSKREKRKHTRATYEDTHHVKFLRLTEEEIINEALQ